MSITKEKKTQIIEEFSGNPGSTETQVALLTERIKNLTEHFKINTALTNCFMLVILTVVIVNMAE